MDRFRHHNNIRNSTVRLYWKIYTYTPIKAEQKLMKSLTF